MLENAITRAAIFEMPRKREVAGLGYLFFSFVGDKDSKRGFALARAASRTWIHFVLTAILM